MKNIYEIIGISFDRAMEMTKIMLELSVNENIKTIEQLAIKINDMYKNKNNDKESFYSGYLLGLFVEKNKDNKEFNDLIKRTLKQLSEKKS